MKKLKKIKGFITDLWMLPLATILLIWHNGITDKLNLMPTLNDVKIGNIVPTIIVFLFVMAFIRLYFMLQYSDVYEKSLMKKGGELWENLSSWQQFLSLRLERWVLIIAAIMIYLAMF